MSAPITGSFNFPTSKQVPSEAIMDIFGKQAYLGNQFIVSTGAVAIAATGEAPILSISNDATNKLSLFSIARRMIGGDATNFITYRLYKSPTTLAAGSAKTPINCRILSSTTSVATCKASPTAVSNGTLMATFIVGPNNYQDVDNLMIIVDPGTSLLLTAQASGQPTTAVAEAMWYEI